MLVLGLESGVRGILGFETKGVSYCGLKRKILREKIIDKSFIIIIIIIIIIIESETPLTNYTYQT